MNANLLPPGLFLNGSPEFLGMRDQDEGFGRATSSADDNGPITEHAAKDGLFNADALNP